MAAVISLARADRYPNRFRAAPQVNNRGRFSAAWVIPESYLVIKLPGSDGRSYRAPLNPRLRRSPATRAFEVRRANDGSLRARYLQAINFACILRRDRYIRAVPLDLTIRSLFSIQRDIGEVSASAWEFRKGASTIDEEVPLVIIAAIKRIGYP